MQYLLLIYEDERTYEADGAVEAIIAEHNRFAGEAAAAGVMRGGNGLKETATATTVRARNGSRSVHDGPFAETHEQLGGYYLLEVANLDEAIAWARKLPLAKDGSVEIRPVIEMPE